MKLSRREFLKWLGIGAAGAALARVAGPVAEDVSQLEESLEGPSHESLERHIWTVSGLVSGSKIRAGDTLALADRGFIRSALPGDRPIGFAVADATGDIVMAYLN